MATKRRKVWVNFYQDGSNDGCAFETKGDAKENASTAYVMAQVAFVERLPGDVVLPREEVAAGKHAAERLESWLKDMKMENLDECDHIRQSCGDVGCTRPVTDAIALLRGRR